jgi:hypothetical protein
VDCVIGGNVSWVYSKQKGRPLSRAQVVTGVAAARLVDERTRRYLGPYLGNASTVTRAAETLAVSVAAMWQQTRALVDAGLVAEVRLEPRAGRAIRWYRAVSDEFEIPLREFPQDSLEAFVDQVDRISGLALRDGLVEAFVDSRLPVDRIVWRYRCLDNGMTDFSPGLRGGGELPTPPGGVWSSWTTLDLSADEAARLRAEVEALWMRWTHRRPARSVTRSPHTVRLAVAPVPRPRGAR